MTQLKVAPLTSASNEAPPQKRASSGRPPKAEHERGVVTTVRLTPARREKLRSLGAAWLSQAIDLEYARREQGQRTGTSG